MRREGICRANGSKVGPNCRHLLNAESFAAATCPWLSLSQRRTEGQGIFFAVLLGVAMATTIAASCALEHPSRVRGLVLASWYELDGYPLMEDRRRQKHAMTFAELHMKMFEVARESGRQGLSYRMRREGDAWLPILPTAPEARERVIRMMSSHSPEHYIKAAEFYTSMPNLVPRLKEIACPVLGICGEEDPSPDRPELLAGMAEFQQVWIPGSRRFTMVEAPSAFNTALASFLARVA
jgi:3-oxoadipate enol-lactonase